MTTKEKVTQLLDISNRMGALEKRERKVSDQAKQLKKAFKKQFKTLSSDEKLMYQDELRKIMSCLL